MVIRRNDLFWLLSVSLLPLAGVVSAADASVSFKVMRSKTEGATVC
jgi:hypothetical protein